MKRVIALIAISVGLVSSPARADDCVRGEPTPLFAGTGKENISGHRFTLTSEHEAKEEFRFGSTTKVEVTHGGCEYVVLTMRVKSASLFATKYSHELAYREAARFLQQLTRLRPEITFDLEQAAATLLKASTARRSVILDRELVVIGDGAPPLQAGIKVASARRQESVGYFAVTLFRGPL